MTTRSKVKKKELFGRCDGAEYAIMLTHHEIQTLHKLLRRVRNRSSFLKSVGRKVTRVAGHSALDHRYHLEHGTCILLKKNREDEE